MYDAVGMIWVDSTTIHPPTRPSARLRSMRSGLRMVEATTLGSTRNPAEFTPIMSMASICSVMRMLPISDEMLEPIFPARMRATMVEQNSRMRLSLTMYPMYILSMIGFSRLDAVWMTSTPPMKIEITPTNRIDEMISLSASFTNWRQNILLFSGFLKTIFMKRKYLPTASNIFVTIRFNLLIGCKSTSFLLFKIYF